jgi:hypothetical protein
VRVGLRVAGQASKRGLIPRLPTPEALAADIEAWLRGEPADTIRRVRRVGVDGEGVGLRLAIHPAAPEVSIVLEPFGRVSVSAATADAGPGYHTYVCQLVKRMGADASIAWGDDDAVPIADDTGYFSSGQRQDVERRLLIWLHDRLTDAAGRRTRGEPGIQLGDFHGHRFSFDGAVATWLGPRDDAWLASALADPRVAADVWPWAADAMDARYLLNRALSLIWTEVRWRPPATPEERDLLDEVLRLLRRAFPLEPGLSYPWPEWQELLVLAGGPDPMSERIGSEAARSAPGPRIGYRREPVEAVHDGWTLSVAGSFAERRTDDEWWAGEGGRSITLAATPTGLDDGRAMPAKAFLERVASHLGADTLHHEDGPVIGRAKLTVDDSSGIESAVLEGYSAVQGSGAAIRVEIHDPDDWGWALDMWRSLRPV